MRDTKMKMIPSCLPRRAGSKHAIFDLGRSISKFGQVRSCRSRSICMSSETAWRTKSLGSISASLSPSCCDLMAKNRLWRHVTSDDLSVTPDHQLHPDQWSIITDGVSGHDSERIGWFRLVFAKLETFPYFPIGLWYSLGDWPCVTRIKITRHTFYGYWWAHVSCKFRTGLTWTVTMAWLQTFLKESQLTWADLTLLQKLHRMSVMNASYKPESFGPRYLQSFGNGTRKTWGGSFWRPTPRLGLRGGGWTLLWIWLQNRNLFLRPSECRPFARWTIRHQMPKCPDVCHSMSFHNFISMSSIFTSFFQNDIFSETPCSCVKFCCGIRRDHRSFPGFNQHVWSTDFPRCRFHQHSQRVGEPDLPQGFFSLFWLQYTIRNKSGRNSRGEVFG